MKIPTRWFRNTENKEELKKRLILNADLLEELYDILAEMEETNYKDSLKKAHYDKASWSEFQADSIGFGRCLSKIKDLLKFTKEMNE